jgi:multidrug efflux pump subunit AcrA (membrane-fusion protein)
MKRSWILLPLAALLIAAGAYFYLQPGSARQDDDLLATVPQGGFEIRVTATGELNAKRSVKIRAPQGMRPAGIYETTLSDLVAEGTLVKEGQYVATLDRTELASKMTNLQTEIEKIQTQLEQARIDTAIEMRGIRDELVNLGFSKKERLLRLEQSRFEPQSVIQQAELDMERTERDYQQLLQKYELKQQQAIARIQEINALLRQNQMQLGVLTELSQEFTIMAPKEGMVIYARTWSGKKEPGSRISAWDPVVAELPDLSDMISKTYVNEVDISRVKVGQEVNIRVDAFPDQRYTGIVIQVANIGEQLRGYDAKVFEVVVQVNESDTILRPAMTTSNEIITDVIPDVVFIPLEALQTDSLAFVYKNQNGRVVRQEVIPGLSNDNEIIIDHGLEAGDRIYLNIPKGAETAPWIPIDAEVRAEILRQQEAEKARRQEEAAKRQQKAKAIEPPSPSSGGSGDFIIIMD